MNDTGSVGPPAALVDVARAAGPQHRELPHGRRSPTARPAAGGPAGSGACSRSTASTAVPAASSSWSGAPLITGGAHRRRGHVVALRLGAVARAADRQGGHPGDRRHDGGDGRARCGSGCGWRRGRRAGPATGSRGASGASRPTSHGVAATTPTTSSTAPAATPSSRAPRAEARSAPGRRPRARGPSDRQPPRRAHLPAAAGQRVDDVGARRLPGREPGGRAARRGAPTATTTARRAAGPRTGRTRASGPRLDQRHGQPGRAATPAAAPEQRGAAAEHAARRRARRGAGRPASRRWRRCSARSRRCRRTPDRERRARPAARPRARPRRRPGRAPPSRRRRLPERHRRPAGGSYSARVPADPPPPRGTSTFSPRPLSCLDRRPVEPAGHRRRDTPAGGSSSRSAAAGGRTRKASPLAEPAAATTPTTRAGHVVPGELERCRRRRCRARRPPRLIATSPSPAGNRPSSSVEGALEHRVGPGRRARACTSARTRPGAVGRGARPTVSTTREPSGQGGAPPRRPSTAGRRSTARRCASVAPVTGST